MTDNIAAIRRQMTETLAEEERNGWDLRNRETVDTWIDTVSQLSFIYDMAADRATNELEGTTIALLVINGISTIFSVLQLNSNSQTNPWLILIGKSIIALISVSATFINGYQVFKKLPDKVQSFGKYAEKLSRFQATASSQITLPADLRMEGRRFILQNQEQYQSLLMEKPNISQASYLEGLKAFQEHSTDTVGTKSHSKLLAITQLRKRHKTTSPLTRSEPFGSPQGSPQSLPLGSPQSVPPGSPRVATTISMVPATNLPPVTSRLGPGRLNMPGTALNLEPPQDSQS